ncbi:DAK2 domain-containing protein [Williamsia sterculiae]|uniref:DhaL domain-containing protein n=1 Tax=Williamsia sterculiae TaxID=1344003 RepID=A0A1N7G5F0_9NOCA|nr:DAK2 domain-containing protein [Williamsia sterculiae]SIS07734.1 hypothetical protein SAMN05445060_2513 [Williamsia sterculiae]
MTDRSRGAVDPLLLRDWTRASVAALERSRGEINDLNVFPIPDSDTGSNMLHTMKAASAAVDELGPDATTPELARAMADGAVTGARGNSGIILSQVLVGVADAAELHLPDRAPGADSDPAEAADALNTLLVTGLQLASLAARRAVSDPRDGTVLTLLAASARAAADHADATPADLARAIADTCAEDLDRTTEQLPELARAGVVDAGGRGLLAILDALVEVLTGVSVRRRQYRGSLAGGGDPIGHRIGEICDGGEGSDFEVMYLLDGAQAEQIGALRDALSDLGDAVVIVGDSSGGPDERFSVHVHTDDPGAAVEAGLRLGHLSDIRITCFLLDAHRSSDAPDEPPPRHRRAVVAVVKGEQAAELFASEGAYVVRADDGLDVSALSEAIVAVDSAHVIAMVNGALPAQDLISVAAEARSPRRTVVFLPTLSMAQCLAAMAVHDISANPDADAYAMAESAASTRWGSVAVATEPMITLAGTCAVGDRIGLIGEDVLVIDPETATATIGLVDLMLGTGGELVTVLAGAELHQQVLDDLDTHIRGTYPGVELAVFPAGQTDQLLQVGVE